MKIVFTTQIKWRVGKRTMAEMAVSIRPDVDWFPIPTYVNLIRTKWFKWQAPYY